MATVDSSGKVAIPADTSLGAVRLIVGKIDEMQSFYERAIGLQALGSSDDVVRLGVGRTPLVELVSRPGAPAREPGTTGLFHLAILLPSRRDLAEALHRVAAAGWSLTGASDHLVSEALYLDDPEGNGIEIYRDRPRGEWRYTDGELQMATLPLDLNDLLGELSTAETQPTTVPETTRIGHVHLQVSELAATESFYHGVLGFDVTVRSYPGALFVSAGGYHHHLGLNTWAGQGAPPPPPSARGLAFFEVVLPSAADLETLQGRVRAAGIEALSEPGALRVSDPSSNKLVLRTSA